MSDYKNESVREAERLQKQIDAELRKQGIKGSTTIEVNGVGVGYRPDLRTDK